MRVPASGSVTQVLSKDYSNYVTCRLRMRSKASFDWWELTQKEPDPLFGTKDNVLEMITFNDLVPPLHFSFFTSTGYVVLVCFNRTMTCFKRHAAAMLKPSQFINYKYIIIHLKVHYF